MAIDITPTSKQNATSDNAYIDLDIQFKKHPNTGDVAVSYTHLTLPTILLV